jgi:hypothetical protein
MSKDEVTADFDGCAVLNLDTFDGAGTHWVGLCWDREARQGLYFDSFGSFPPDQLERMAKEGELSHSLFVLQQLGDQICG